MSEQQQLIEFGKNALPPLSSRVMFWRPRFIAESLWLEHIPFYFWLIEAQQPKLAFDPDVMSGSTYFALCQAVDKLNTETFCLASFHPKCASSETITHYNEDLYQEFSFFLANNTEDKMASVEDASVDLLILKHDSELLKQSIADNSIEAWRKKLSDSAIVLIHGSQKNNLSALCHQLKQTYSTFEFLHGGGLLVVATGQQQSAKVTSLMSLADSRSGARVMHEVYARLGLACQESWVSTNSKQQIEALEKQLSDSKAILTSKEQEKTGITEQYQQACKEREALQQENCNLNSNIDLRFEELAKLTQMLMDADQKLETVQSDNQSLRNQLSQARQEQLDTRSANTKLNAELNKANSDLSQVTSELRQQNELNTLLERDQIVAVDKISQLKQSELKLKQSLSERFDELATLTNMLQKKEQELEAAINEIQATQLFLNASPTNSIADKLKNKFAIFKQKRAEEKQFSLDAELIHNSELFDEVWYISQYPEAKNHKYGAAGHYLEKSLELGTNPSENFDGDWYLQTHHDVKHAGMNPLLHYLQFGHKENRLLQNF